MTENTTPQTGTAPVDAYRPCVCAKYVAATEVEVDGQPDYLVELATGCTGTPTTRDFAPGHDAKLKSMLIKAGVAGLAVTDEQGSWSDAMAVAKRFGFATMVENGILRAQWKADAKAKKDEVKAAKRAARATELGNRAQAKAQKAAERKAAKNLEIEDRVIAKADAKRYKDAAEAGATKAENAPALPMTSPVKIKVGRWEYTAEIDEMGTATFTNGKGEIDTREEGTYRLLGS